MSKLKFLHSAQPSLLHELVATFHENWDVCVQPHSLPGSKSRSELILSLIHELLAPPASLVVEDLKPAGMMRLLRLGH